MFVTRTKKKTVCYSDIALTEMSLFGTFLPKKSHKIMSFQYLFQILPVQRDNLEVLLGQNLKVLLPSVKPSFLGSDLLKSQKYYQSNLPLQDFYKKVLKNTKKGGLDNPSDFP